MQHFSIVRPLEVQRAKYESKQLRSFRGHCCWYHQEPSLREISKEIAELPQSADHVRLALQRHQATQRQSFDQIQWLFLPQYSCRSRHGDEGHNGFLDADT